MDSRLVFGRRRTMQFTHFKQKEETLKYRKNSLHKQSMVSFPFRNSYTAEVRMVGPTSSIGRLLFLSFFFSLKAMELTAEVKSACRICLHPLTFARSRGYK